MIIKFAADLGMRLLALAAPTLPPPIVRPDQTARNARRLEAKSLGRGQYKRG